MLRQAMRKSYWLSVFLIFGLGCQTKKPIKVMDLKDLAVCIYSHDTHSFECGDNKHIWDLATPEADGFIAYPPEDHERLMRECLK